MSDEEEQTGIITKRFKNKQALLEFLSNNDIPQASFSQQQANEAWSLSFPRDVYERSDKNIEPDPEPPKGA